MPRPVDVLKLGGVTLKALCNKQRMRVTTAHKLITAAETRHVVK